MEMTIKTWQPPPANRQKKGYTPKFRLSCDACSQAKVRCDHERPSCQRCSHAGIRCVYSVSRRIGKPSKPGKSSDGEVVKAKTHTTAKSTSSSIAVQTERAAVTSSPPSTNSTSTSTSIASTAPTSPFPRAADSTLDCLPDCGMPDAEPLSSDFLTSLEDDLGFDALSSNYHESLNHLAQAHGLDTDMLSSLNGGLGEWNLDPNFQGTINHMADPPCPPSSESEHIHEKAPCVQLTSSTLHSLSLPFDFCSTSPSVVPPVTIDRVLDTSRQAMAALNTLLQCSCAQSGSSGLSIALIILKVLDSYGAVARSSSPASSSSAPPSDLSSTTTHSKSLAEDNLGQNVTDPKSSSPLPTFSQGGQNMVLDTPITIGVYTIRGEDEHRLILHLLLSELRRVERLVEAFRKRYSGDVFHGALEHFLKSRVYATRGELKAVLSWESN